MRVAGRIAILVTIVIFVMMASPRSARAQSADPEQLFAEASALMESGKFGEALPKLQQAQKTDPGIGIQFNIAVCQQSLGMLGSAFRSFREVAQLARASGKKAREEAARTRIDEVRRSAPAFEIHSRELGDVTVRIDGQIVNRDDWAYYPVDPGTHTIDAAAPAKKPWKATRATPATASIDTIDVPALETAKDTVTITKETTNSRRTVGFILGGIGLAGVVTAGLTGGLLLSDSATVDERCPGKVCRLPDGSTDQEGADAVSRARTLLPINAIAWGVAVLGLGSGAYLLLTSGKRAPPRSGSLVVAPFVGASSGAAILTSF